MKKTKLLSSHILFAILLALLAVSMGVATIIENDFGTQKAQELIYRAWWFEMILVLTVVNLIASLITKKTYKIKKLPIFILHIALIFMLLGAGATRYFGYEGTMHIRENKQSNEIITKNKGITITKNNKKQFVKGNFDKLADINETFTFDDKKFTIKSIKFYKNAYPIAKPDKNGIPIIGFVVKNKGVSSFSYIGIGQNQNIEGFKCSFNTENKNADVNFFLQNDSIFIKSKTNNILYLDENKKLTVIKKDSCTLLKNKGLYKIKNSTLSAKEIFAQGKILAKEIKNNSRKVSAFVQFEVSDGSSRKTIQLWEHIKGLHNTASFGNTNLHFSYGNRIMHLPFDIYLTNFELTHYPGSNSPSSFSSYVVIKQLGMEDKPFHIYMNNILKINGFRFFQSSYDPDEKGTVLSVNYDSLGTTITYIGYFLLFLGIILNMCCSKIFKRLGNSKTLLLLFFMLNSVVLSAQTTDNLVSTAVDKSHAEKFGELLIQDNNNRTKPLYTMASDLSRKLYRSEFIYGLSPAQVFLEMNIDPKKWSKIPIIKIKNSQLCNKLNIKGNYVSYSDLVPEGGHYILRELVQTAYSKSAAERSKFDKAVIKADERANICYSIFSGNLLRVFPDKVNTKNNIWLSLQDIYKKSYKNPDFETNNLLLNYLKSVKTAKKSKSYSKSESLLNELKNYQRSNANYSLPTNKKIKAELLYYKLNIFKKLFPFYASIGVLFLITLIISIIKNKKVPSLISYIFYILLGLAFVVHTFGLVLRWYISGHAPVSNGYEAMTFIAWVTILAGFTFSKKSQITMSATSVLAGMTLMVANLSFMDPVITNLVPVLQSYWLTLHVSVITASYAFLALGSILGIINQVLFATQIGKQNAHITQSINDLTAMNIKTLKLGLGFLTIGTFLGAIWANESWGRYWGWDPKETWSLITIIVYTFVTHLRLISGIKGTFVFNILSLYAISSVLMTYFGVNYYLSGLHSYAGGAPVPIPDFLYYAIALFVGLSFLAWIGMKKSLSTQ